MKQQSSYSYQELIDCAHGKLFGSDNAQLPLPPMLMIDKITKISNTGGQFNIGEVIAELEFSEKMWFFDCHFYKDPVMPGCLGLDALWQLLGFYLGWCGYLGKGRALGCGRVKFQGQIQPTIEKITYHLHIKKVMKLNTTIGVAFGELLIDDNRVYNVEELKVGLFRAL